MAVTCQKKAVRSKKDTVECEEFITTEVQIIMKLTIMLYKSLFIDCHIHVGKKHTRSGNKKMIKAHKGK